jgi:hypothetical protein
MQHDKSPLELTIGLANRFNAVGAGDFQIINYPETKILSTAITDLLKIKGEPQSLSDEVATVKKLADGLNRIGSGDFHSFHGKDANIYGRALNKIAQIN